MYVRAQAIFVGQWRFFPEAMAAQNMHNGNWVRFRHVDDDKWVATGINIPAQWMLDDLIDWFGKWIAGKH